MTISEPLRNLHYFATSALWRSGTPLQAGRSRVRFLLESLWVFIVSVLPAALMTIGSTQPLNRNKWQGYLLGGKDGRCVGLTTLPPSCAGCLEILVASTFMSPKGSVRGLFCLYLYVCVSFIAALSTACCGGCWLLCDRNGCWVWR